ncbi:hypothetical protein [Apilactobacillus kunkeei]|uniref:hypothetical protein n=1 Tax=Apilactobacillus kunkeei TaxID=148814 RepID=UPI001ED99AA0|nr:hypothetical protein [Apilactobacillus kunkeei]
MFNQDLIGQSIDDSKCKNHNSNVDTKQLMDVYTRGGPDTGTTAGYNCKGISESI